MTDTKFREQISEEDWNTRRKLLYNWQLNMSFNEEQCVSVTELGGQNL